MNKKPIDKRAKARTTLEQSFIDSHAVISPLPMGYLDKLTTWEEIYKNIGWKPEGKE